MLGTMNQPELYQKSNRMQRLDAQQAVKEYLDLVRWLPDGQDVILDVGCGTGDVTWDILKPALPADYKELVGTDISEKMVRHACEQYPSNRVKFKQLDVSSANPPPEFSKSFDHVFSFFCLHWVQDQRKAMRNMFSFLRPGGDMLLTFLAKNPIYDVYLELSCMPKWKPYMNDVKKFVSPYHFDKDPEGTVRKILEKSGFDVGMCKCVEKGYTFPNLAILQKSVTAICPFMDRLPEDLKEDYFADYVTVIRRMNFLEENNNSGEETIKAPYNLMVIYATRPL